MNSISFTDKGANLCERAGETGISERRREAKKESRASRRGAGREREPHEEKEKREEKGER